MDIIPAAAPNADEVIRVLENSLYPGAKPESIALVLSYCRVNGLDPMLKPVHIVPTSVKIGPDKYEMRDVLMPGIADYRIKAARSGQYAGKSEPEYGPERTLKVGTVETKYPDWCRVTVSRIVQGRVCGFAATERWLENYATAGRTTELPNTMWRKRAYGQLAKCAEAQALRMAFPEFSGGLPTAEEMEGKTGDFSGGPTIEHEPEEDIKARAQRKMMDDFDRGEARRRKEEADGETPPDPREQINAAVPLSPPSAEPTPRAQRMTVAQYIDGIEIALREAATPAQINQVLDSAQVLELRSFAKGQAKQRLDTLLAEAAARAAPEPPAETDDDGSSAEEPWPGFAEPTTAA